MTLTNEPSEDTYHTGPIANVPESIFGCAPPNGALHNYLWWATQTTDAPTYFHLSSILPAAACEIAKRGWLIGVEQQERPRMWSAMIAGPGVGKSTAINTARDFYTDFLKLKGEESPYITAEGSSQGLFQALAGKRCEKTNVTAAILVREEFSIILNPKRRDDLATTMCEWADGRYFERHTVGLQQARQRGEQGHDVIQNPAISATFVSTEQSLLDIATLGHMQGGLFSRFDWFVCHSREVVAKMHRRRRPEARQVCMALWDKWFQWLDGETLINPEKIIKISPEAVKYLKDTLFVDYCRALQTDDPLGAQYKRAITHAYIIAGVYAMSCARSTIIPIDMHRAVNLLNYCLDNISSLAPEIGVSPLMKATNRAFETIKAAGPTGVTRTPLYRRLQVPKGQLDMIIETLTDEGSVVQTAKVQGKNGRPAVRLVAVGAQRFVGAPQEGKVITFQSMRREKKKAEAEVLVVDGLDTAE